MKTSVPERIDELVKLGYVAKTVINYSYLQWMLGGEVNQKPTHGLRDLKILKICSDNRCNILEVMISSPDLPALVALMKIEGSLHLDDDGIPLISLSYEVTK
jgi:hypothetical protein